MGMGSEVIAGLVGGAIAIGGQIIVHWVQNRPKHMMDEKRKKTLLALLDPENMPPSSSGWRKIETLERVIGASREETKRLLFEIDARGGTLENDVWALIKHKPLPTAKEDD